MACKYYFKGQEIGTETELLDFFTDKYPHYPKFGDKVFQLTPLAMHIDSIISEKIAKDGERAHETLRSWYNSLSTDEAKSKHLTYNEEGRIIIPKRPNIGVNKFLSLYRNENNERITTEFDLENYWAEKFKDWGKGLFTEDEIELIKALEGIEEFDSNPSIPYTEEKFTEWRHEIEKKWKAQGKIGTAIHYVSQWMFSKTGNSYNFELVKNNPLAIQEAWEKHFKGVQDEYGELVYSNYLTIDLFKQCIEMILKFVSLLRGRFGKDCIFYPELKTTTKASRTVLDENGEEIGDTLLGVIDLLVIDEKGRTHIFDYKTSPKIFEQYGSPKKQAFTLQLAVYDRILRHYGINTDGGSVEIVPIQLQGFKKDLSAENVEKYSFEKISYEVERVTDKIRKEKGTFVDTLNLTNFLTGLGVVSKTLDEFLPDPEELQIVTDRIVTKTEQQMKTVMPTYGLQRLMTRLGIIDMLTNEHAFEPTNEGRLTYTVKGATTPISINASDPDAKEKLVDEVEKVLKEMSKSKSRMTHSFVEAMKNSIKYGTPFSFASKLAGGDSQWLSEIITPYINGDSSYDIIETPAAESLWNMGIILLENHTTKALSIIKLSVSNLDARHHFGKNRNNINGKYKVDSFENAKSNSFMLKASLGNMEAMETMFALLNCIKSKKTMIEEIKVINPYWKTGVPEISNRELLYTFNTLILNSAAEGENVLGEDVNRFDPKACPDGIRLLNHTEILTRKLHEIMDEGYGYSGLMHMQRWVKNGGFDWKAPHDKDTIYKELIKMKLYLETDPTTSGLFKTVSNKASDLFTPELQLYAKILKAMNEIKDVPIRQNLEDSDKWFQGNLSISNLLKNGWSGTYVDNAGYFNSPMLNKILELLKSTYLNTKDVVLNTNYELKQLILDVKDEAGWGRGKDLFGNQTNIYQDMITITSDGDLVFVNPKSPTLAHQPAKRKLLEFTLENINKQRYPNQATLVETWKQANDPRYYRVPLMTASTGSKWSAEGFINHLGKQCKKWSPKAIAQRVGETLSKEDERFYRDKEDLYKMNNRFNRGEIETERRKMLDEEGGTTLFEQNIETILLNHTYAYTLQENMDEILPLIKASVLLISLQGANANPEEGNFNLLIGYLEDFVKAKIKGESIDNPKVLTAKSAIGRLKQFSSMLALAFSPLLLTYQTVQSIWNDIVLIIRKPDGSESFTVKNMWDSFKLVYKNLFTNEYTLEKYLNEQYSLNDMDANEYANRISSDHGFFTHFTEHCFRFATRPDFYSRMTIWESQMRGDGSLDAYIQRNGRWVYDWSLDKRYAAYAAAVKANKKIEDFTEAEATSYSRYLAAAIQFKKEGVRNQDGTVFEIGQPLPKAYTNLETASMKSIADDIYGFYDHETKSLMNSTFMLGLHNQMLTYWSAKKNQFLQPGGTKLLGRWEDYKENEVQMYYARISETNPEIDPTRLVAEGDPEASTVKVRLWKGTYQEGIIKTLTQFITDCKDEDTEFSFRELWEGTWSDNEDEVLAHKSNIKLLAAHLFFWTMGSLLLCGGLLSGWDDDLRKEFYKDKGDTSKAMEYMLGDFFYKTLKLSFIDFNFISSIGSPILNWEPFAFSSLLRLGKSTITFALGDHNAVNYITTNVAAARQIKPLLQNLAYSE